MCATFTVLWILCVWGEHVLTFPFGQNMRRLCEPRESLNREHESFPHGFPLHRITLESDRAPCFHLHHQKGASVPPAIIKGPIQPARDDRITLRPKTKLSLPLVSPVPPILHFRCLSGHAIWASSAFKFSWEFHIYKLGSRNYNVRCVQIILVQDGMGKKQPFTLLQVCVPSEWFWNWISLWKWILIFQGIKTVLKKVQNFPTQDIVVRFMCVQLLNMIFLIWLQCSITLALFFSAWMHSESPSDTSTWNSLSKKVRHPFSSQNFYSQI